MEIKQNEKGLYEKGFDDDLPQERIERILELFPSSEAVTDLLFELREVDNFTDMKRGELYPEVIGSGTRLRRTIANVYGVDLIQAQPNFSCNGCIDTFLTYIQRLELTDFRRNGLMVATPTYFRYYHKIESLRLNLLSVPFRANYEYPLDEILTAVKKERPSCLFIVTPNNPTGIPIPDQQLFELLDNIPDALNVAIDRTCVNIEQEVNTKTLLQKYPDKRIAIFHSFSKYYGMSHLRIGFAVFTNRELAAEVDRYLPFGLNLESVLKATYILTTGGELKPSERILNFVKENKSVIQTFLERNVDFSCSDFKSNYAILTLPDRLSSEELHRRLLAEGIFVMPGHELPTPDSRLARIHTGGPPQFMRKMLDAIERWS
jgi:histidinol-phosphate aminotransferase